MTFKEFLLVNPALANTLRGCTGDRIIIEDVGQDETGRWVALCLVLPYYDSERLMEARCHPNCRRGVGVPFDWVWEGHECCVFCIADSSHHYQACHE